jgi:DNA-binding NtrC family response regulator
MDLPVLVDHFLRIEVSEFGRRRVTPAALDQLRVHAWPGNVRELRHTITRTLLWTDETAIEHFEIRSTGTPSDVPHNRRGLGWNEVAEALRRHTGRLQPTADALQVSVRTLQRRMRDLEMNIRDFR